MLGNFMRENREAPAAPVARVGSGPVGEGHKPQDPRERGWGVGQTSSTNKVPEQRSGEETSDASAEGMEGRRLTKRNSDEDRTHRTPSRTEYVPGLERVRAAARRGQEAEVHCTAAPCKRRFAAGQLRLVKPERSSRSGRGDLAAVWGRSGGANH